MIDCDFCYKGRTEWDFKARSRIRPFGWDCQICDSCKLLLQNVIGPALHLLTHSQIVEAVTSKMDELGITYEDLMKPADFKPKVLAPMKAIEGEVVSDE